MLIATIRNGRRFAIFCLPVIFAAAGCSNASLIGISAVVDESQLGTELTGAPNRVAVAPRGGSLISPAANEHLQFDKPTVGDIDGDGFDDFIVSVFAESEDIDFKVHLFYGKPEFAEQLSTGQADATFEGMGRQTVALGDINCDGLADFALGHTGGYEVIFGATDRLSGSYEALSSGTVLTHTQVETQTYWYLQALRALGDLDGDDCDELIVTLDGRVSLEEHAMRPGGVAIDYVLAGRAGTWPSGTFDRSWAVAEFGDEPPTFEKNGASEVIQRLRVIANGDLDADGFMDVLAAGRSRIWVFYGSEEGLSGTLTPTQAAASLNVPFALDDRVDFARKVPILISDLDGDGTAEIGLPNKHELGIVYGSRTRWSGRVTLEPDLTIVRPLDVQDSAVDTLWYALEQGIDYRVQDTGPAPLAQVTVTTTDLDGDGRRELLLQDFLNPRFDGSLSEVSARLYSLTGPSKHSSGRYVLSDKDLYALGDIAESYARVIDPGGDFDGDGSGDLLIHTLITTANDEIQPSLWLVPGPPHAPE